MRSPEKQWRGRCAELNRVMTTRKTGGMRCPCLRLPMRMPIAYLPRCQLLLEAGLFGPSDEKAVERLRETGGSEIVVSFSLPPSFASQNPPPSSEGGSRCGRTTHRHSPWFSLYKESGASRIGKHRVIICEYTSVTATALRPPAPCRKTPSRTVRKSRYDP